jgi:precorrin-6x reductase
MNTLQLKSEIKKLAEEQKVLKNQRKTVHLVGERTMDPWKASVQHSANRIKLNEMYQAYGLMRGKTPEQIQGKEGKWSENYIDYLMRKYNPDYVIPVVTTEKKSLFQKLFS